MNTKSSTIITTDLFKRVNEISSALDPLLRNAATLYALIEAIDGEASNVKRTEQLEGALELYNVRMRGLLTELKIQLKEQSDKLYDQETTLNTVRQDILDAKAKNMYKQPTSMALNVT